MFSEKLVQKLFCVKFDALNVQILDESIACGVNAFYVPGQFLEAFARRNILTISTDHRADLVVGQDVSEVLLDSIEHVSVVARDHGALPCIIYCTDWRIIKFKELMPLSGNLLQHSTSFEFACQGIDALPHGASGIVLETMDISTIRKTGRYLNEVLAKCADTAMARRISQSNEVR